MYITNSTRLDIIYVIGRLRRYTQNLNKDHQAIIDGLARYLKGTIDYELNYSSFLLVLEGYNDANQISRSYEIKSTSGYIFALGGGIVSWKSSKQTCISCSSMDFELICNTLGKSHINKAQERYWIYNV